MRHFKETRRFIILFGISIQFVAFPHSMIYAQTQAENVSPLMISEFYANSGFSQDTPDWIEVYNTGTDTIDMSNMYLTDDLQNPSKARIQHINNQPVLIYPNEYKSFYLGKTTQDSLMHLNIGLNKNGDQIGLCSPEGAIIDSFTFGTQKLKVSCGRKDTTDKGLYYFKKMTPNKRNFNQALVEYLSTPKVSKETGYYGQAIQVEIQAEKDSKVCYTLDGSDPELHRCKEYIAPIQIEKTSILKAIAVKKEYLESAILTKTYLIREAHSFPVVSITIPNWKAKYNKTKKIFVGLEHSGEITLLDTQGQTFFSTKVGISLAGESSLRRAQKSISIHTRSQFGKKWLKYPFFADKPIDQVRGVILRNGGNAKSIFKDALLQNIASELGTQDYLSCHPVVGYVNGKYYGIYNIREKKCKHYFEDNHSINGDSLDYLNTPGLTEKLGNKDDYLKLYDFVKEQDLGIPDNMDSVLRQLDIDNFIDYNILNIFYGNTDCIGNKLRLWKPQKKEGKWRWIFYDLDLAFRWEFIDDNTLKFALGTESYISLQEGTLLFRKMVTENESIRNKFIGRFSDLLNTSFTANHIQEKIDSFTTLYHPEIKEHFSRWKSESYPEWETEVYELGYFAQHRPKKVWQYLKEEWNLGDPAKLSLRTDSNSQQGGFVKINSVIVKHKKWEGNYFKELPILLEAIPIEGHSFSHWECSEDIKGFSKNEVVLNIELGDEEHITIIAHFKKK